MANSRVSVDRLREGMIITSDVYTKTGMVLVAEGTPVTKEVVRLLTRHFVEEVMVSRKIESAAPAPVVETDKESKEKKFQQFREEFRVAEDAISENLMAIANGARGVDPAFLLTTLNSVLQKAGSESELMEMIGRMKSEKESLYSHALNVALLGQMLAQWEQCTKEETENVVLAGILHDIGIMELQKEKQDDFTYRDELLSDSYEKHVIGGYNILKNQQIPQDVKQAVLTHHERLDGTGYPLRVPHANICKVARILAIVDTYDTLTMEEKGEAHLSVFDALKKMESIGYHKLDAHMLMTFIGHIADTTIQRDVRLSDGRIGQIIMINKFDLYRPVVKVNDSFVDLAKQKELRIEEIL